MAIFGRPRKMPMVVAIRSMTSCARLRPATLSSHLQTNADHLFDRGFIGFEDNGDVLVSPVAHVDSLARMGLNSSQVINVGRFSGGQRRYLEFHRESVLLRSRFLED